MVSTTDFPLPSADLKDLVGRFGTSAPARVFPVDWQGETLMVKLAVPPKQKSWHRVQAVAARLLGQPLLSPTVNPGGAEGLRREALRLREVSAAGVLAPRLVALSPGFLVMTPLGTSYRALVEAATDGPARRALLLDAAAGLAGLHAAGQWHGNGELRDIMHTANGIGFVDFEEDPVGAGAMDRLCAQARDLLRFLLSCSAFAKGDEGMFAALVAAYCRVAPADVFSAVDPVLRLARPLAAALSPVRRSLGRDARQAVDLVRVLSAPPVPPRP